MGILFKFYKRKFRNSLEPIFVMLIAKRSELQGEKWKEYVRSTRGRIINNPEEFLGRDLPHNSLMCNIVEDIFDQFIKTREKA